MLIPATFTCPHCWAAITTLLDLSVPEQELVEDCEVCCRPIRIHYRVEAGELLAFSAESE